MAPTSTSPVFTPTRRCTPSCVSAIDRCMASAARTARSASSSWATGAPNRAMMASPTILSTRPPKSVTSTTSRWKHRSMRYFTCSGSRVSDNVVNPTMSANTTVTTRRSSCRTASTCPQDGQKRAPSGASVLHTGQVITRSGYVQEPAQGCVGAVVVEVAAACCLGGSVVVVVDGGGRLVVVVVGRTSVVVGGAVSTGVLVGGAVSGAAEVGGVEAGVDVGADVGAD